MGKLPKMPYNDDIYNIMERGELSDENSDSIPEIEPGLYRSKQQTTDLNNIVVEQPPNEDRVFKSSPSFSDWIPTENDA